MAVRWFTTTDDALNRTRAGARPVLGASDGSPGRVELAIGTDGSYERVGADHRGALIAGVFGHPRVRRRDDDGDPAGPGLNLADDDLVGFLASFGEQHSKSTAT